MIFGSAVRRPNAAPTTVWDYLLRIPAYMNSTSAPGELSRLSRDVYFRNKVIRGGAIALT